MVRMRWLWGPLSPLGVGLAVLTVAVDQAHKWWMLLVYRIEERGRVAVTPFLDLVYVKNLGVSYGMFLQESREGQWLLAGFAVLAALAMAVWLARGVADKLVAASLGFIMGGRHQQCHRPPRPGGGGRLLFPACLRLLLVRVQYCRCSHCCRGLRPPV